MLHTRMLLHATSRRPRLPMDGVSRLKLRVWPQDIDLNWHQNNARYFARADLGRYDWWLRSGQWHPVRDRGVHPIAGDSSACFVRALPPLCRYELATRLLGWDHKWFFHEQRFVHGGQTCAVIIVRYLFTGPDRKRKNPQASVAACGWPQQSPTLPAWVVAWSAAQDTLRDTMRA